MAINVFTLAYSVSCVLNIIRNSENKFLINAEIEGTIQGKNINKSKTMWFHQYGRTKERAQRILRIKLDIKVNN